MTRARSSPSSTGLSCPPRRGVVLPSLWRTKSGTSSRRVTSPRLPLVLVRRTVVAVAAIVIACVPLAVFALISGQVAASSFAVLGGATALANLAYGGRAIAFLTVGLLTAVDPGRDRVWDRSRCRARG